MPFHPRAPPPPRTTKMPAEPSASTIELWSDMADIVNDAPSKRADPDQAPHADVRNEQVLARQLSAPQQALMALGGAIGTGLFLASGLAVNVAGPAVIVSYGVGGVGL